MKSINQIYRHREESNTRPMLNGRVLASVTPMDNQERLYWHRLGNVARDFFSPEQGIGNNRKWKWLEQAND